MSSTALAPTHDLPRPYLLFLGDVVDPVYAKTAFGLRDWAPDSCVGEITLPGCRVTTGLPHLSPAQAAVHGARALVIGVAPPGGRLDPAWLAVLHEALRAGLDVISGMHGRLADDAELATAAAAQGRRLIDLRRPLSTHALATGRKRTGMRLLTIGTDCALGKKYTALALTRAFRARGAAADFRATGQTGILIAGSGIAIDAVISDFIAGAAEALTPDAPAEHWDVIEGQGSLSHPAYAGVSLGLLHGSQPDVLVACHAFDRERMLGFEDFPTEPLEEVIDLALRHARRVNPKARCAGVSLNTSSLSLRAATDCTEQLTSRIGLPCADPLRGGAAFERLVTECLRKE